MLWNNLILSARVFFVEMFSRFVFTRKLTRESKSISNVFLCYFGFQLLFVEEEAVRLNS